MNTYHLHSQLSCAVRSAASLRQELSADQYSILGRFVRRVRHAYLMSNIESLTRRLRSRY